MHTKSLKTKDRIRKTNKENTYDKMYMHPHHHLPGHFSVVFRLVTWGVVTSPIQTVQYLTLVLQILNENESCNVF